MLYLLWSLFIIVYVFGYKFIIGTSGKTVVISKVDSIVAEPSNKNVTRCSKEYKCYGNVTNIQKVIDEKKQKTDLREQYNAWKDNARLVNEYYNREHTLQMKSG